MLPEMDSSIYFDNNATTRLIPEVIEELEKVIVTPYGNPSSAHSFGDFSRKIIQNARNNVSLLLGCNDDQIMFTSGASEANLTVLQNVLNRNDVAKCIITSPSEHSSIKENCAFLSFKGFHVIELSLDSNGIVNIDQLKKIVEEHDISLVTIGWANNETGVIQPIEEIATICKESNIPFHTDASQFFGRGKIDVSKLNIDFLSFTGHKLHAPQGIGALYVKTPKMFIPLQRGGEQEHHMRAGTENVLGIAGLGKAIELRIRDFEDSQQRLQYLRDYFEKSIEKQIDGIRINGKKTLRTPNTSNIQFCGIDGRALVAQLDMADVYCSQTSACTSMIPEPSATLRAMGLSVDEAFASIRFSFAIDNTFEEIDRAVAIIKEKVETIRRFYNLRGAI